MPSYAAIGFAAPVLLVFFRLIQGFSAGGESVGAPAFVLEHAPLERRGLWLGVTIAATALPGVFAGGLILGLNLVFGPEGYEQWAWRIPFLLALPLSVFGFWIRRRTEESPEFQKVLQSADSQGIQPDPRGLPHQRQAHGPGGACLRSDGTVLLLPGRLLRLLPADGRRPEPGPVAGTQRRNHGTHGNRCPVRRADQRQGGTPTDASGGLGGPGDPGHSRVPADHQRQRRGRLARPAGLHRAAAGLRRRQCHDLRRDLPDQDPFHLRRRELQRRLRVAWRHGPVGRHLAGRDNRLRRLSRRVPGHICRRSCSWWFASAGFRKPTRCLARPARRNPNSSTSTRTTRPDRPDHWGLARAANLFRFRARRPVQADRHFSYTQHIQLLRKAASPPWNPPLSTPPA